MVHPAFRNGKDRPGDVVGAGAMGRILLFPRINAKRAVEWTTALVAKEEKEAPYDLTISQILIDFCTTTRRIPYGKATTMG
jgi:hypothetical protein